MKAKIAASLILVATAALAGESQYMTPTTDRAQQTQQLLTSAANAVNAGNQPVSDLWVFPTAESDTVFAQYSVKTQSSASKAATVEQRLEVLKLKGDRIVERQDLTRAGK